MAEYRSESPISEGTLYADGTTTQAVANIGDAQYLARRGERMPAFVALAKSTGGVYAENEAGMTTARALEAAQLNYRVSFEGNPNVTIVDENGVETVTASHLRATVATWPNNERPRAFLGAVGSKYKIFQPDQVADFGQTIIDEGGANVIAAGAYGNPAFSRLYLAFKLPGGIMIGGEDPHDVYLTLGGSHDGSTSMWGTIAPIRLSCTNQQTMTFGNLANKFKIRHTGSLEGKIEKVRAVLRLSGTWTERFNEAANKMLGVKMTERQLRNFTEKMLPTPAATKTEAGQREWDEKRQQIIDLATLSPTCELGRGTAWAAYNAFTEWADWFRPARDEVKNATLRYSRIVDGDEGERWKVRAANLLLARA